MRKMKDSGIEWIGEIPENVNILRNKYLISYIKGKLPANINTEKEGIPYIGASDLEDLSGNCTYTSYTTDTTLPLCSEEDVLILWDGARAGLIGTNHKGAVASTVVNAIPKHTINKKFWYWYLKAFQTHLYNRVNGTTIPHMNTDYIEEIAMLDWTIEDQEKIAAYLDQKCAEIDAIIAAKEKTNELLKECRQSIIYEAVTKGLDHTVPMKDSGIEWIGEIPENWEVKKIKHIGNYRNGLTYSPNDIVGETDGTLVLRSSNIQNGRLVFDDNVFVSCNIPEQLKVHKGDILICSRNGSRELIGKNAIIDVDDDLSFGAFMMIFRCHNPKYMSYILNSNIFTYYLSTFLTATVNQLTGENFGNMKIVYCNDEQEQKNLVEFLDKKCKEIDILISSNNSTIKKLKEYRQSVIYEAVTGKVEI